MAGQMALSASSKLGEMTQMGRSETDHGTEAQVDLHSIAADAYWRVIATSLVS